MGSPFFLPVPGGVMKVICMPWDKKRECVWVANLTPLPAAIEIYYHHLAILDIFKQYGPGRMETIASLEGEQEVNMMPECSLRI